MYDYHLHNIGNIGSNAERFMALQAIVVKGKTYFFSATDSDKKNEIMANPQV